ncbi:MAG: 3-hydroxyacyl-ACP dehydratase FabZ [Deltaproteobacteria bacterium]|jgi:3-hydroxyacyl-[acyl-carrier-protein] dehydratase|nr:3-hydroxyacyl-ACP dehydratase FabZ [Deltaproteobacteria bacterium]
MDYQLPLLTKEIEELLPHRYPFLLVDKITEFIRGERIVGYKNVTINEPFFTGHFPGNPIMPGVLMIEALAQIGSIFAKLTAPDMVQSKLVVLSGLDDVRFRRKVIPGDILKLEMFNETLKMRYWKMRGLASVDGKVAVEGKFLAALV